MKFKCPCGSPLYQIFRTAAMWHGTYVSEDDFPDSMVGFDMEDLREKWTVQCELCNKKWGPKSSFRGIIKTLKKEGVLT